MFGSTVLAPLPVFADVIEAIWDVDVPDAAIARGLSCKVLPSVSTVMVVHYRAPISSDRRGFEGQPYKSVVTGVQSETVTLRLSGDTASVVVRFKPDGAARVFGDAMAAFADANVELAGIVGDTALRRLQDQLASAGNQAARARAVQAFIAARLRAQELDGIVRHALRSLRREPAVPVSTLARRLEISERHLSRCFAATVGVPPKQFARLVRAEQVLAARWRGAAWAEVAQGCGYGDQAHMINDFKRLAGATPEAFMRQSVSSVWGAANARLAMSGFCNTAMI